MYSVHSIPLTITASFLQVVSQAVGVAGVSTSGKGGSSASTIPTSGLSGLGRHNFSPTKTSSSSPRFQHPPQLNKPSLLRRSRVGPIQNPLLNHFTLNTEDGGN